MRAALLVVATLLLLPTAEAEVFKCSTPDGRTEYRNMPCDDGARTENIYKDDQVSQKANAPATPVQQGTKAQATPLDAPNRASVPSDDAKSGDASVAGMNGAGAVGADKQKTPREPETRAAGIETTCNEGFCYDNQGRSYVRNKAGTLIRNDGKVCTGNGTVYCN